MVRKSGILADTAVSSGILDDKIDIQASKFFGGQYTVDIGESAATYLCFSSLDSVLKQLIQQHRFSFQ